MHSMQLGGWTCDVEDVVVELLWMGGEDKKRWEVNKAQKLFDTTANSASVSDTKVQKIDLIPRPVCGISMTWTSDWAMAALRPSPGGKSVAGQYRRCHFKRASAKVGLLVKQVK